MGKRKTRKFIDKKNAITCDLVHRSQKDPLAADENAPQRVLVVQQPDQDSAPSKKTEKKSREEEINCGIDFDDEYDYLQHIKSTKDAQINFGKISLPSVVFASIKEEEVGLLNKAAPVTGPQPDLDPDVVDALAALDDDFDFEDPDNKLDDDFMTLINPKSSDTQSDGKSDEDEGDDEQSDVSSGDLGSCDEDEDDEVGSLNRSQFTFRGQGAKSRYSSSSSTIERSAGLKLLDDRFDHAYSKYDDMEQGALDHDDIEGYLEADDERIMQCVAEFEKQKTEAVDNFATLMKERLKLIQYSDSSDDDYEAVEVPEKEKWDCQSILSTYSTIYNHPKLIDEPKRIEKIKINPRTGIPQNVLEGKPGKLTAKGLAQLDLEYEMSRGGRNSTQSVAESMRSTLSILSIRPKNELPEDRKKRKQALKEYRKERRIERKANAEAFKEEKKRQEKILLNNKNNIQGNRIL